VPDLTRIEAWSRYIEFLSDAAHAHAPSTVSIEPVGNVNNTYAIEGRVSFDDGTEALATTDTVLSQKDEANMASLVGGTLTPHPSDQQSPSWS
jgi:hypothetical protein